MKFFTFYRYLRILYLLLFFVSVNSAFAQRNYATSQQNGTAGACLVCSVTTPANAADGNLQSFSTLNVSLGLLAQTYQVLIFPASGGVAANTPVTIKLGSGNNLLDATLLGGILLQAYNGNNPIGSPVAAATLLSAVSSNNQVEVILTPTQTFDRVRVTLDAGLVGAASSIVLYDAYYGSGPGACNTAIDELHGISSTLLGLGVNVGGVVNPERAIDGDTTTFSTLNAGVAIVGSYAQQTIIYNSPSVVGDSVRLILSIPQTLLNAGVLTGITVSTYNGNTSNNDSRNLNSSLLNVRLLDLSGGNRKVKVTFVPQNVFDRVQLRLGGGIASLLSTLNLYEAQHIIPSPVVTVNNIAVTSTQVCSGSSATLTATAVANTVFHWYIAPTGGSPVFTGQVFTTPGLTTTTTYYVAAMRNGCTDESQRKAVTITVNPLPAAVAISGASTATICSGQTASFTAQVVSGVTVNWYTSATGGTPVFTGNTFTTPVLTANTNYYAEAQNATGCVAAARTQVTVTVNPTPVAATLTATATVINSGQTTTINITNPQSGVTYNWYTAPSGGTIIFTGTTFITPALTNNTTYYVEGVSGFCTTPSRAQITITVNPAPDITVTPSTQAVNRGQTATFTASSTTPGTTFNWYTTPTRGTPIFTGATFTTPAITAGTTYYAEATNPSTGAVSATRVTGTVTLNPVPDVAVTPPTQTINSGQTATLTASSTTPGETFNWYTAATGGAPIFTGATFTTPPLTANTTYYAEAKDPVTGAVSSTRASGAITVNPAPDIGVTPPTQVVNSGQTATFTASSTTTGATFNWYTTPTGGSPVFTGATFTTPPITAGTVYYADATDPSTGAVSSTRATATVTVNGITPPDVTVTPQTQAINTGQTAMFTATSTTPNATFKWYTTPTGGSPVFSGAAFTTPPISANTTYYAESIDPVTNAVSLTRASATVTVNQAPDITVNPSVQAVNVGQTATFNASSTTPNAVFNWYTSPTGGSPIFTGATFTTAPISANTTYYAESINPATGAVSPGRATATVTLNPAPDVTVTPPTRAVNAGQTTTFTASSTTPGEIFNWYTTPTGSAPIFTGATFTTPPISSGITYYAEAKDPVTGAVSATRATGTVTVNPAPDITVTPPAQAVNAGQTATFTASSTAPGATFNWYTTPTGGSPIFTGATFTTPPASGNAIYYAEAIDPSTGAVSTTRATATLTVNPAPDITVTPSTQAVNVGQTAIFTASSTVPGATFNWYTTATGGTPIFTGATFTTPQINSAATYYADATDPVTGAVSTTRAPGAVTLNPVPDITVTPPTQAVNSGQTATFTASSTTPGEIFNWYTAPTGGAPIFTGATFTSPPLTANTTYYAEAKDPVTGAVSATRASGAATVNPAPDVTVAPPTQAINSGQTATFTAASTTPGATFNWYNTPTGGTALFTGATFTSPALTAAAAYYAEAVDPVSGAVSATRARGIVTINGITPPDITVTPPTQTVNPGQRATLTASSTTPNAVFNWYTSPTGGTSIFTGASFTSGIITSNRNYYAEATDPVSGAVSVTRAEGMVIVNAAPDVTVSPSVQALNSGQTATFKASSDTPGATFNWYNTPTGGTSIFTGAVFTTPPVTANTIYYAEAVDPSTGAVSTTRATGTATINSAPDIAVTPPTQAVNTGQTATFTASSTTPGELFNWYTTPTGGSPIFTGPTFTTPPITANTTYYAEAKDPTSGAVSTTRATGTVTINSVPDITVTPPTQAVNTGQTATFTASSTTPGELFNWYTTPTGGTPVFTGATFITPPITANTVYYAEAKDPITGATSTTRTTGTITVNAVPDVAVTPPTQAVNTGQTATFTASSTTPNATFNWYTTPTGGSRLFTGATFTTPPITAGTIYYVEATDPVTGAVSATRATATVTVNSGGGNLPPSITVTPSNQAVNPGQTATFTAFSTTPGEIFNWYTTATGGTPIFTGPTFTTPTVNSNVTYYAEAKDPVTGAVSTIRATGTVIVNTPPDISVNPSTQSVNVGATAKFTASSTIAGTVFKWYTTPTGGTAIYTGSVFTTPPITAGITYYVEAVNPITGLVSSSRATAKVTINDASVRLYVPNAFTPNNDGKNDIFYVYGPDIKSLKLWVYDQWGELQFQSSSQANGWDGTYKGKAQPVGVYVYYVEATLNDNQVIKKKGTITLLR
jgi:gliding motility-associated-like protein